MTTPDPLRDGGTGPQPRRTYDHPDLGTMGGYDTSPPGIVILLMVVVVAVLVVVTR